jgi:hypothetical protein
MFLIVSIGGACGGGDSKATASTARPTTGGTSAAVATTPVASTASLPATATIAGATAVAPATSVASPPTFEAPMEVDAATAMCATAAETTPATVASPDVVELSGIAASRVNGGVLWAHNDSGDTARVFAMDAQGGALATYMLVGADAIDWEDIAVGPDASRGASELYLGDIGDNARARPNVVVYRLREPAVTRGVAPVVETLADVERLTLRYPDGPHDAETLMVDPVSGDLIIVTKDADGSEVFRAPGTLDANASATLELVGRIDFSLLQRRTSFPPDAPLLARVGGAFATGGDISATGDVIGIRTYAAVWLWTRAAGEGVGEALAAAPCEAASVAEPQGEAFGFDADGRGYVTSSEGAHPVLHHFLAEGVTHRGS